MKWIFENGKEKKEKIGQAIDYSRDFGKFEFFIFWVAPSPPLILTMEAGHGVGGVTDSTVSVSSRSAS